ncbi:energy coupling factor transporter S component ThiW [Macrococcus lamae]|uniref:Energy coupling factor transporter S component ThiW n=1 Tax=Macrococcus lamae TaxID=198484 RepID=A0A4R6BUC8_9STAP|nr:energy coupling factor transporter S component ThiW [Macrococcus lamae]TDM11851.1 energy coupling factor transporter S component ThiW [Macrococcus lamae]
MERARTRKLTLTALLTAVNVLLSQLIYIPLGPIKALPMQHLINVVCAVTVGPWFAVMQALMSSIIRNMVGTGTFFAFPGSMIGALLSSLLYRRYKKVGFAVIGEAIGTGLIGSLICIPVMWMMNTDITVLKVIMPAFIINSIIGSTIAAILIKVTARRGIIKL